MKPTSTIGTRVKTIVNLIRRKEEEPAPIVSEEVQKSMHQGSAILDHARALAELGEVVVNEHTEPAIQWIENLTKTWREADRERREKEKKNGRHKKSAS